MSVIRLRRNICWTALSCWLCRRGKQPRVCLHSFDENSGIAWLDKQVLGDTVDPDSTRIPSAQAARLKIKSSRACHRSQIGLEKMLLIYVYVPGINQGVYAPPQVLPQHCVSVRARAWHATQRGFL